MDRGAGDTSADMPGPPDRAYWFQRHPLPALAALALCLCVLSLLFAELAARVVRPEWAPTRQERVKFWTYDPLLGWAHRPNQRGRFTHRDFSTEVVINSRGLRARKYPLARGPKRRMLVLGDSFGWGFGVNARERFSEILEDAHPDWEVINASVSAYGTDQEYLFFKERGIAFRPDVVLVLFCENDFDDDACCESYWRFKPCFHLEHGALKLENVPVPKTTFRQRLDRFFLGSTYLGPRLYRGAHAVLAAVRGLKDRVTGASRGGPVARGGMPADEDGAREVTYRLLGALRDLCRANAGTLLLVSVPMSPDGRAALGRFAESAGIAYLPLDAYLEPAGAAAHFPHDYHWNARGHQIAAAAIDTFLVKERVFPARASRER
jgi:hypothetical protein